MALTRHLICVTFVHFILTRHVICATYFQSVIHNISRHLIHATYNTNKVCVYHPHNIHDKMCHCITIGGHLSTLWYAGHPILLHVGAASAWQIGGDPVTEWPATVDINDLLLCNSMLRNVIIWQITEVIVTSNNCNCDSTNIQCTQI